MPHTLLEQQARQRQRRGWGVTNHASLGGALRLV